MLTTAAPLITLHFNLYHGSPKSQSPYRTITNLTLSLIVTSLSHDCNLTISPPRTITSTYYRGTQGVMVVYAVSDLESFGNVRRWLQEIEQNCDDVVRILGKLAT